MHDSEHKNRRPARSIKYPVGKPIDQYSSDFLIDGRPRQWHGNSPLDGRMNFGSKI